MPEFKVGDRVRMAMNVGQQRKGTEAEVTEIGDLPGPWPFGLTFEDGELEIYSAHEIEKIPSMEELLEPAHDMVNHPPHYRSHPSGIECIQITEHMGFTLGNAVKYVWRADLKGGVEDLRKAVWYIEREIALRS